MLRTHTCGQLTLEENGQEVTLCGWVDTARDHGGTLFIDIRDRYGKTQVVFAPEAGDAVLSAIAHAAIGRCDPGRWQGRSPARRDA